MLAVWVVTVWCAWLGALGLAAAWTALRIWNPNPILPVGLTILMLAAGLGLGVVATVRLIRGPRRDQALAALLIGTAPFWLLAGHILLAMRPAFDRHSPPGWPSKVFEPLARPLLDLEARWFYPERTPGKWVTMIGAPASDAPAQIAAMDRHIEASLAPLNRSATWPIVWYRGPIFGLSPCAIHDMAIGSEVAHAPAWTRRGADGLTDLDRHEVAHCVINQNDTSQSDPPRLLMEGWAQANQGTPADELALAAWDDREKGRSLTLRQLVAPDWYWYSGPAAYNQGAPLVDYILRVYGPERFLKLYTTCRQATFDADCRTILGIGLDELDAAYWVDVELIARRAGTPTRVWLKGLKLNAGVDRAAWNAFVDDYLAAAERLLAPYQHLRLTTVYSGSSTDGPGKEPESHQTRQQLLRSGPFARLRKTESGYDQAYLASPVRSIQAHRDLETPAKSWTITEDPRASGEQSYRRTLHQIDKESTMLAEPACYGGLVLLQFPESLRNFGFSTDYEVVTLNKSTQDGHNLVTLRLRTGPDVKGRDRADVTFVLDADDFFVVRSVSGPESEARYEYDHKDGRPIFRKYTSTGVDPTQRTYSSRLEVTECRFGPIPESEFDPQSFLEQLKPEGIITKQVEEPSAATPVDGYWLAFVVGGISVVAGAGTALGSRSRDHNRRLFAG